MKVNKILSLLLIGGVSLGLVGCGSKSLSDYDLKEGNITAVCTKKESFENIDTEIVTTLNFDENQYLMNMKIYYTEKDKNKEEFEYRAEETKANAESYSTDSNIIYNYKIDEKKQVINYETIFTNFDLSYVSEEEKINYKASEYIRSSEQSGSKCKITGSTRTDLGLD